MIQQNQPSKFRTRGWVEINDESKERYDNGSTRFKTFIIRSNLYDYIDAYIFIKGTTTVTNTAAGGTTVNNSNKKVISKNCAPFPDCISEMNNIQKDDSQKIDIVIAMYDLI